MPRADAQQPISPATGKQPVAIPVSKASKKAEQKTITGKTRTGAVNPNIYKAKANGKAATGNSSKYDPKFVQQAEVLMREHGFTEAQLAEAFLVSVVTLTKWKTENPDLLIAINKGRDAFDNTKVRGALRSRALGYKYEETEEGVTAGDRGGPYEKTFKKKMAPDVTACIFWLVNRQPDDWKHVARTIIQGDPKNPVAHKYEFDLSKLPEKELAQLESIVAKARADKATGSDASGTGRSGNA